MKVPINAMDVNKTQEQLFLLKGNKMTLKFLKLQAVMSITGMSRSSIYLAISEGRFPKQVNLGARSIAFLESEVQEWMEHCIANRRSN
jgi:prophage regulatory protein